MSEEPANVPLKRILEEEVLRCSHVVANKRICCALEHAGRDELLVDSMDLSPWFHVNEPVEIDDSVLERLLVDEWSDEIAEARLAIEMGGEEKPIWTHKLPTMACDKHCSKVAIRDGNYFNIGIWDHDAGVPFLGQLLDAEEAKLATDFLSNNPEVVEVSICSGATISGGRILECHLATDTTIERLQVYGISADPDGDIGAQDEPLDSMCLHYVHKGLSQRKVVLKELILSGVRLVENPNERNAVLSLLRDFRLLEELFLYDCSVGIERKR